MNPSRGGWAILLSLAVAMLLSVVHLPEWWPQWLGWLRPNWVALTVFFWVLAVPHRFGLVTAWFVGLLVDVLQAEPLGLNAVVLSVLTYVTWSIYERVRMFPALQQAIVLFMLLLLAELLRMLCYMLLQSGEASGGFVIVAATSALLWPIVRSLLSGVQQGAEVV